MTTKGKFVRVKIRACETLYIGDIHITDTKSRVSDIINDNRMFIELVNATEEGKIDDIEIGYIALHKSIIESVSVVEENSEKEAQPYYGYEINKEQKDSFQHTITDNHIVRIIGEWHIFNIAEYKFYIFENSFFQIFAGFCQHLACKIQTCNTSRFPNN